MDSCQPLLALFVLIITTALARMVLAQNVSFAITNFSSPSSSLIVQGNTLVGDDGSLHMTYNSSGGAGPFFKSRVLHSSPILMHDLPQGLAASFSISFTFSIAANDTNNCGDGFAFVIAPNHLMPQTLYAGGSALGLYDVHLYDTANASLLHFVAVEYDTYLNVECDDPSDDHIGLDIDSVVSIEAQTLPSELALKSINFSRRLITWIDYDALLHELDVYVSVAPAQKTSARKVLSYSNLKIWDHVLSSSYVGFTASTGLLEERLTIYAWNFSSRMVSIPSPSPSPSPLPSPSPSSSLSTQKKVLICTLSISLAAVVILLLLAMKKRLMAAGLSLDGDLMPGPRRFTYRELRRATGDFKEILGHGGSGEVYKGVVTTSSARVEHVAVKRISRASKQREKEFKSEVLTIGRLRHRNLVQLYGWCSEKGELLLVYEFMPNGSLDKLLYTNSASVLSWPLRFNILRGVAAALVYLHLDLEKRIIHRDIKASNVMLDLDLNARLSDFGLARFFDHNQYCTESSASGVAGTWGYMAPEYAMSGRVTMESDIFSFGVLALEIACGRRPFPKPDADEESLVDYVWRRHEQGQLMHVADERLEGQFDEDEMRCMLHLGLLCSHPDPKSRLPTIQVLQILRRDVELPELPVSKPMAIYVQVATTKVYKSGIYLSSRPSSSPSDTFEENMELSGPR